ncbi:energy transducer TonB [Cytophaga aurantiaca]|uniref:energy transducer TonB n=1 Tax=Cytophaga aurantiaca TaxID=29530 RepID=UPI001FE13389|nr:energy transducer TonB [Cytophaga aurantiaca]
MKQIVGYFITLFLIGSSYMGFSQTKIDTVYVKYHNAENNTTKDSASFYRVRTIAGGVLKAEDYSIEDSSLESSAHYKSFDPYVKQGYCIYYLNDSVVYSEGDYMEGKKSGIWKKYYSSGELWYTETDVEGDRNGTLKGYYKTGEIKRIEEYKNDTLVTGKCYTKSGKDTAYYEMYIMPAFPGGEQAKMKYIQNHIIYPKKAMREHIQGTVYVSYVVTADGSIDDVKILKGKGVDELLDAEAIRCLKAMPTWTPGYIEGSPEKVRMIQRIKFSLTQ